MQLLAVSPESEYANEAELIVRLLQAGLDRYHLRKPSWSAFDCAALLNVVPVELHPRISIHQHHVLAGMYGVGVHFKDVFAGGGLAGTSDYESRVGESLFRSRSLHGFEGLEVELRGCDYGFLSPVFQSISKSGYVPSWTEAELRAALSQTLPAKLYALGGITAANAGRALDLGFDGVVLHGSLWQSADPLVAFESFRKEAV